MDKKKAELQKRNAKIKWLLIDIAYHSSNHKNEAKIIEIEI